MSRPKLWKRKRGKGQLGRKLHELGPSFEIAGISSRSVCRFQKSGEEGERSEGGEGKGKVGRKF